MDIGLQELGFLESEEEVYQALLGRNSATAGELADITGYNRVTVYKALDELVDQGLASYVIKSNKKEYEAADPKTITRFVDQKEKKLDKIRKRLNEMRKKFREKSKEVKTNVYEGIRGAKTLWEELINSCEPGDEYLVAGAPKSTEKFGGYFNDLTERLIENGGNFKVTYNRDAKGMIEAKKDMQGVEMRVLPREYVTPASLEVFRDRALVTVYRPTLLMFAMTSEYVADSFRDYFHMIWDIAEPVEGKQ